MIPDYRIPRPIRQGAGFVWTLVGAVHRFWRRGRRPVLAPPVLVVGALRAGGSGKTDCVAWIARRHPDLALLVHPTGDEDRMLRGRFPGRVFVHRDLLGAWAAARSAGFVRGVSDGGLQDPALDGCPALVLGRMRAEFHELHPCGPYRQRRPARPVQLEVGMSGGWRWRHEIDLPQGSRVLVGAGVARTENVVEDLRGMGVETAAVVGAGDHRKFPSGQVELLQKTFPTLPWVITAKDQARGEAGRLRAPVHVLRRELEIDPELACRIDALVEAL